MVSLAFLSSQYPPNLSHDDRLRLTAQQGLAWKQLQQTLWQTWTHCPQWGDRYRWYEAWQYATGRNLHALQQLVACQDPFGRHLHRLLGQSQVIDTHMREWVSYWQAD